MLKQIVEITWLNLRSIPQRIAASLVIVIGIAGVVGVFTALFAMSQGIASAFGRAGDPRNAMVLRGGSQAELNSSLDRETLNIVEGAPGVRRNAQGEALVAGELIVIAELPKRGQRLGANVTLRGVTPAAFDLRPQLRLVAGRMYTPGLQELIVGNGAASQFEGLEVGRTVRLRGADWRVVGLFATGDAFESEIWTDAATAQTAWGRSGYSTVLVRLDDAASLPRFAAALAADPRLNVDVKAQIDYLTEQTAETSRNITILGTVVAVIMGLGAIFAALNTMYAAVSVRAREIATLRAIGFSPLPVVASVLVEAMLLALAGGLIGAALAWLFFNGMTVSTLGGGFTQLVFQFRVSLGLVATGLVIALAIGFLGGLFPALRAARLPVTSALRAA